MEKRDPEELEVRITDGLADAAGADVPSAGLSEKDGAGEADDGADIAVSPVDLGKNVVSVADLGNIQTLHRELDKVKEDDFKTGDSILGRYNVISTLSRGETGPVFKCLDTLGGINVAVKCLPRDIVCNEQFLQDVVAAYSKSASLRHPGITGYRTTGRNQRTKGFYIVRDIADGDDLRIWIHAHQGAESADEKLDCLRQLASALDYAHARGVVHGEIRPANIIISPDGHAELMNFGISHSIHTGMTKYGIPRYGQESSLPYVAPEVVSGALPDALSDQYSLAAVAYTVLSGTPPFSGSDVQLLKKTILEDAVSPLPSLPAAMSGALAKALSKNPADRFESCSAFVDALTAKQPGNPLVAFLLELSPPALLAVGLAAGAVFATIILLLFCL